MSMIGTTFGWDNDLRILISRMVVTDTYTSAPPFSLEDSPRPVDCA